MGNRIETDELRRIVAQQDLAEFICPKCGCRRVRVTADFLASVVLEGGRATNLRNGGFSDGSLYFSCENRPSCTWSSDNFEIAGDGNDFIPDSASALLLDALKNLWNNVDGG